MSEGFLPTQDSRAGQRQPGTARVPSSQRRLRPHGSSVRAGPQPHGRAPEPRPAARGGQCVYSSVTAHLLGAQTLPGAVLGTGDATCVRITCRRGNQTPNQRQLGLAPISAQWRAEGSPGVHPRPTETATNTKDPRVLDCTPKCQTLVEHRVCRWPEKAFWNK